MQPLVSRSSLPPPTPNPKAQYARRRKKDAAAAEDEDHGPSEDDPPTDPFDTPSHASHSQATPRTKFRKPDAPTVHPLANPHKRRSSQKATSRGVSADARVEHLLLAARKIGKQRAGIMSGMVQLLEERERERRREESATTAVASTPKTPKRTSHAGYPEGGYVYMNSQMRPGAGMQPVPMFIPAYHHLLQTPSSSTSAPSVTSSGQHSAQKSKQDARTNNPPTPLDSLLSAARSMMREDIDIEDDEEEEVDVVGDSPAQTAGIRHARPKDLLGSPVPKRRKVAARSDKLTGLHELASRTTDKSSVTTNGPTNAGAGRIRSALDVLADQAAAFSTQEQSGTLHQTQTKGKGKDRADPQLQDPSSSTPKARGRTKSRKKELEMDAPSPAPPTSRSVTPQSDTGDHPADSTRIVQPRADGSVSEALVDPGGGANSAGTSQRRDSTSVPEGNQVTTTSDAQSPGLLDTSLHTDDSADATPRQGSRVHTTVGEDGLDGTHVMIAQPNLVPLSVLSMPESERCETSPPPPHVETTPESVGLGLTTTAAPAKNKELLRVVEQDIAAPAPPAKRQRSPYVKWSKEEDDLLAQVRRPCPRRHCLTNMTARRRSPSTDKSGTWCKRRCRRGGTIKCGSGGCASWVRLRLQCCDVVFINTDIVAGVFDSKPDLSSFQTAATTSRGDGVEPRGNPKLGLAPLSSEKAFSGLVGRPL